MNVKRRNVKPAAVSMEEAWQESLAPSTAENSNVISVMSCCGIIGLFKSVIMGWARVIK